MSRIEPTVLDSNLGVLEQLKGCDAGEISLIVVAGRCFFPRDVCVNLAPESGWKCSRCGYDAEGFRGRIISWNFCPGCGAVNQEVL